LIRDAGQQVMPGVTIFEKGTTKGTLTDSIGLISKQFIGSHQNFALKY
jgi:hypothetical protein